MAYLKDLWFATLTRTSGGTDSRLVAIVNQHGKDRLHHTIVDTIQEDQDSGQANLYHLAVGSKKIQAWCLDHSSVRVGIRGSDQWRPEHVFVWGKDSASKILPIAAETSMKTALSTDSHEGPLSVPIDLVGCGTKTMLIRRLLLLMTTSSKSDAGTDSSIELNITHGGGTAVHYELPDTPQADQNRGEANLYFVPVKNAFRKEQLGSNAISLRIKGSDMWLPTRFFLFGLDSPSGNPDYMVPLVHLPSWNQGWMSTDSSEGKEHLLLKKAA